jgi:hypothetical protein
MDENVRNSINPTTSEADTPATSCVFGVNDAGTLQRRSTTTTQRCLGSVRDDRGLHARAA